MVSALELVDRKWAVVDGSVVSVVVIEELLLGVVNAEELDKSDVVPTVELKVD